MAIKKAKTLEANLWEAADLLRANSGLNANQYAQPVLGLIFLRFVDHKFARAEKEFKEQGIDPETIDFQSKGVMFVPKEARYGYLNDKAEEENIGKAINEAMKLIEAENTDLKGILPKNYTQFEDSVLVELLRKFYEIPEFAEGDMFGKIYEYFLGKFAMAEGSKGGEYFTPTSIVKLIVEILEPYHGNILDPACGSGGMFVQSAHLIEERKKNPVKEIAIYGQEKNIETVHLCKMNLAVHGLPGNIKQTNTFYDDPFSSVGKFDFVMANPPFNVDGVDKDRIKEDKRYSLGLPSVDNANYLWMQIFYSALNAKGRAGYVMASGADGSSNNSEKEIRKNIIQNKAVDVIIAIRNKFFFTVGVPCTLWFLDKGKKGTQRENKVLFIDARKVFRKIDAAHCEFTPEQTEFLTNIVRLYREETISDFQDYLDVSIAELKVKEPATKEEEKELPDRIRIAEELKNIWQENFADNKYNDIKGLCKVEDLEKIEKNDWQLNPGRYVGTAIIEEDDEVFEEKMNRLTTELTQQFEQSKELEQKIQINLKDIGF